MDKKVAKIWEKKDVYIVLDNGGGLTLVIPTMYQHTYNNARQCAEDLIAYLQGDDPASWDGNELCICDAEWDEDDNECPDCGGYQVNDPSIEDINNGGYRVIYGPSNLHPNDPWGCNETNLAVELGIN